MTLVIPEPPVPHEAGEHVLSTAILPVSIEPGCIIDFETTGRPWQDPEHEVVTLGYMTGNRAVVIQRRTADASRFYGQLRSIVLTLPRPFLAYNAEFEMAVMQRELGMDAPSGDFADIMQPWRAKAEVRGLKWPRLDELISEPEQYFREPRVSGREVPAIWKWYLATKDDRNLALIADHCLSDVLREAVLVMRYQPSWVAE